MKRKTTSYARFYALLNRLPGDRTAVKEELVSRYTGGRTTSLREMGPEEYETMCRAMEAEATHPGMTEEEYRAELRRLRSAVLKRIQRLGIDTSDWTAVDRFCGDPRICGKCFAALRLDELRALLPKLEAIAGRKPSPAKHELVVPMICRTQKPC